MGALVGALFTRNINKTNNKQCVSRGYDSESGTTILKNPPTRRVFAFVLSKIFDHTDSPTNLPTSSQFIRDFLPGLLYHFIRPISRFVDLFYRGVTA